MRDAHTAKPQTFRTGGGWFPYNLAVNLGPAPGLTPWTHWHRPKPPRRERSGAGNNSHRITTARPSKTPVLARNRAIPGLYGPQEPPKSAGESLQGFRHDFPGPPAACPGQIHYTLGPAKAFPGRINTPQVRPRPSGTPSRDPGQAYPKPPRRSCVPEAGPLGGNGRRSLGTRPWEMPLSWQVCQTPSEAGRRTMADRIFR